MKKMTYMKDLTELKRRYCALFDLDEMRQTLRTKGINLSHDVKWYLEASIQDLAEMFEEFQNRQTKGTDADEGYVEVLKMVFDYSKYHDKLAEFFMNPDNGFNLRTCHYCDMAYINSYGWKSSFVDELDFINRATKTEWRMRFDQSKLSAKNMQKILSERPYPQVADFDNKHYLSQRIQTYQSMKLEVDANHFDLDHVLPKSLCPLVGLSLFNFVPSCQVCNEKLKGAKMLGRNKNEWVKLSPTDSAYDFENGVIFRVETDGTCTTFFETKKANADYHIEFDTHGDDVFNQSIDLFRLRDRYNYHKKIALHILDLKERYEKGKRDEISKILSAKFDKDGDGFYSESQVYEDIFDTDLIDEECFSKMKRDLLR